MQRDLTDDAVRKEEQKDRVFWLVKLLKALYHTNAWNTIEDLQIAIAFLERDRYGDTDDPKPDRLPPRALDGR